MKQGSTRTSPSLRDPIQETQGGDKGKGCRVGKSHPARLQVTGISGKVPMHGGPFPPLHPTTTKSRRNLSCLPSWPFTGELFNELKEEIELTGNHNHPVCLQKNFPTSFVVSIFKRVRFSRLGLVLTYICIQYLARPGLRAEKRLCILMNQAK